MPPTEQLLQTQTTPKASQFPMTPLCENPFSVSLNGSLVPRASHGRAGGESREEWVLFETTLEVILNKMTEEREGGGGGRGEKRRHIGVWGGVERKERVGGGGGGGGGGGFEKALITFLAESIGPALAHSSKEVFLLWISTTRIHIYVYAYICTDVYVFIHMFMYTVVHTCTRSCI